MSVVHDFFVVADVVHRNISCDSIHLTVATDSADAMLGGFEFSCLCKPRQHLSASVGHIRFMAPEMLLKDYSFSVDSYALGVVLYRMLAGQLPVEGQIGEVFQH